jgi:hypothetical protein
MSNTRLQRAWEGPLLVAIDQDGAEALRVHLAELETAAGQLEPVALRSADRQPLYRVVELFGALGMTEMVEAVRTTSLGPDVLQRNREAERKAHESRHGIERPEPSP